MDEDRPPALRHPAAGLTSVQITTDVLVIGGGLSGLAVAEALHRQGRDFHLIEARDRFGGRIHCATVNGQAYDLGPAWFWPGQPRMDALVRRLGLSRFEQFSAGLMQFEDSNGAVQSVDGFAAMAGSWRLDGGMTGLTAALAKGLPSERLHLGTKAERITAQGDQVVVTGANAEIRANNVILALLPRLAAGIQVIPPLPASVASLLQSVPTWMAGQAKAIAIYNRPFWREHGLSGDAMSRHGPMVEVHDASPKDETRVAILGFIGVPPQYRVDEAKLESAIRAQLVRLFGDMAAEPLALFLQDWAKDSNTATPADQAPLTEHPIYGEAPVLPTPWDDKIIFAGSEVAPQTGGFLEGALEAAAAAVQTLERLAA